jgi:hypothetical protein
MCLPFSDLPQNRVYTKAWRGVAIVPPPHITSAHFIPGRAGEWQTFEPNAHTVRTRGPLLIPSPPQEIRGMSLFRPPAQLNSHTMLRTRPSLPAAASRATRFRAPNPRFKSTNDVPKKEAAATAAAEPEGRSFKGQLYDSTYARLQRERAEQKRFAEMRAGQPKRTAERWFPIVFGTRREGAPVWGELPHLLIR